MNEEKKRSYNPLKLWGTYLGILAGLVGSYYSFALVFFYAEIGLIEWWVFFIPAAPFVIGGTVGYMLHLVFRKLLIG